MVIVSAPKKLSVTTGRSLLNLPTLQSRRQYLFHNFTHKKVAKNKASKHILTLINKVKNASALSKKHLLYYKTFILTKFWDISPFKFTLTV